MAFSFNAASTPAFGATSAPAFNFGGAAATPAFGASSTPGFGATSAPAFGAAPLAPAFGASAPGASPFGGAVSTPAFSFSSAPSLFGGAAAPAFGAAPAAAPSPFGAAPSPSFFGGGGAPSLFGAVPAAQQAQQGPAAQLVTKDNRPVSHSTKWDDLAPQAQAYLLELEKVISGCREECRQLDGEERLASAAGARAGLDGDARALAQSVTALGVRVRADAEEAEEVRGRVMHLLRHTEAALHTYKRTHAWREAARAAPGQPLPPHLADQLGGPVALPSPFLVETVAALGERLRAHEAAARELEAALQRGGGRWAPGAADPGAALASLQSSVANLHDCLMRTAAALQTLDDRLGRAKAAKLAAMQAAGDFTDPFAEAERQDRSAAAAAGAGGERKHSSGAAAPGNLGSGASPQQAPVAPMTGLFGTASPPPAGGFGASPGTGLFGAAVPGGSGKRSTRRR